ncbi:MAG: h16 [Deltaproteobacteria bacterium]|nr:h16 [Deltaproteobacteria bacterium]
MKVSQLLLRFSQGRLASSLVWSDGRELGIKIKDIYWTMGAFDAVFTAEAPDDETMTAFAASMGSLGNIRTQTMRAFSAQEMNQILAKLPTMDVASAK